MRDDLIAHSEQFIAKTYKRFPIVITRGEGCRLWDSEGRCYTDFVSGIAVCNLGHAHPKISRAISRQAETLLHVSNLYYTLPQADLACRLVQTSFADRVFFCNSGAEANEAAIKLARKYFSDKGEKDRYQIVSMRNSFHGRTLAALSATGQDKIKQGFDPLLQGFDFVPINEPDALRRKIGSSTCAVMLEPIQGEGGVRSADAGFLSSIRQMCDNTGTLLIFDEIQTGMGRTGRLFAYEHFGVKPDIMTLAKALANGLPIGAMLAREEVASSFGSGSHASTFGGTPIVSAAAMAVLDVFEKEKILDHCRQAGTYFKEKLLQLKDRHDSITDVRGLGLLLGMELNMDGGPVVAKCLEKGFLINCVQGNILRFIPPLIIQTDDIDALIIGLDDILSSLDQDRCVRDR